MSENNNCMHTAIRHTRVHTHLEHQNEISLLLYTDIYDIYTLNLGVFMYKFKNSLLPTTFDKFFTTNQDHHRYPTRSANQLRPPRVKTKLAENFITKAGVGLWNEI